jgi:hypothetical protein
MEVLIGGLELIRSTEGAKMEDEQILDVLCTWFTWTETCCMFTGQMLVVLSARLEVYGVFKVWIQRSGCFRGVGGGE